MKDLDNFLTHVDPEIIGVSTIAEIACPKHLNKSAWFFGVTTMATLDPCARLHRFPTRSLSQLGVDQPRRWLGEREAVSYNPRLINHHLCIFDDCLLILETFSKHP